jgi:hypothetical protein
VTGALVHTLGAHGVTLIEHATGVPATVTRALQEEVLFTASLKVRTTGTVVPICEQLNVFGATDLETIPQLSVLALSTSLGVIEAVPPDK